MRRLWVFRSPCVRCFSVHRVTGERVKGAIAAPLTIPAPGKENRRFAVALSLFLQAFGSGTSLHPCRLCPLGASLRLAPAFWKRFGDFQPDQAAAVSLLFPFEFLHR